MAVDPHTFEVGDKLYITGVSTQTALNGNFALVTSTTATGDPTATNKVEINKGSSSQGDGTGGGASICASMIRVSGSLNLVEDFNPVEDSTITLICDGAEWFEVHRSYPIEPTTLQAGCGVAVQLSKATMNIEQGQICIRATGTATMANISKPSARLGEQLSFRAEGATITFSETGNIKVTGSSRTVSNTGMITFVWDGAFWDMSPHGFSGVL